MEIDASTRMLTNPVMLVALCHSLRRDYSSSVTTSHFSLSIDSHYSLFSLKNRSFFCFFLSILLHLSRFSIGEFPVFLILAFDSRFHSFLARLSSICIFATFFCISSRMTFFASVFFLACFLSHGWICIGLINCSVQTLLFQILVLLLGL